MLQLLERLCGEVKKRYSFEFIIEACVSKIIIDLLFIFGILICTCCCMKTIFAFNPSKQELEKINLGYYSLTEKQYITELERRAKYRNTSVEYEAIIDFQYLFELRGEEPKSDFHIQVIAGRMPT